VVHIQGKNIPAIWNGAPVAHSVKRISRVVCGKFLRSLGVPLPFAFCAMCFLYLEIPKSLLIEDFGSRRNKLLHSNMSVHPLRLVAV